MLFGKLLFLFLGIYFGIVCVTRAIQGIGVKAASIFLATVGITGVIYLQWLI